MKWGELGDILLQTFHSDGREEEPGLFYVLLCSELMEKVTFLRSNISLISRCDHMLALVVRINFCVCFVEKVM